MDAVLVDKWTEDEEEVYTSGGPSPNGKWEVLDRPEKLEESVARRLNCALDDIAQENKDDELNNEGKESGSEYKVRRQNATLEDFTSFAKRGRKNDLLCSPPSKSKRGASINITEDRKVARSIKSACHALKEPKHQVMRRVFDQTGEEFVFTLIEQVEKVEEAGGQFVADGTRRRTKGGVFFNLLKAKISKEQWDYIFEEERAIQKRKKAFKRRLQHSPLKKEDSPPIETKSISYKDCLIN